MSIRKLLNVVAILALCIAAFVVQKANAAGVQATITTRVASYQGIIGV